MWEVPEYLPTALYRNNWRWENLWKVAELADEILFDLKTTKTEHFAQVGNIFLKKVGSITNFVGFPIPLVALSAHIE